MAFLKKPLLLKIIYARPRLAISLLSALIIYFLIPIGVAEKTMTKAIISWDVGAIFYLLMAARMMFFSTHEKMNQRAQIQDEGKFLILIFVVLAVFFALGSIFFELAMVKELQGVLRFEHIALTVVTILTSWFFTHVMFALHYAHDYYGNLAKLKSGGLLFPETEKPDYADFLYFSFVIGTSGQTADVSFTSKEMRRTGLVHCVLAFFFNTTLLALTINIASGLF